MINNEITDGVVYNPILNEFYWASVGKGHGVTKKIRVSRNNLTNCLIGTGIPFSNRVYEKFYTELDNISKNTGVRRLGSAALDLPMLRLEKLMVLGKDLNLWDICSGVLLVKDRR